MKKIYPCRHSVDKEHCVDKRSKGFKDRFEKIVYGNMTLVGLLSLAWLLIRSGRKPTRLRYPCQKAALANTTLLFGGAMATLVTRFPRVFVHTAQKPRVKRVVRVIEAAGIAALVALLVVSMSGLFSGDSRGGGGRSAGQAKAAAAGLAVPSLRSGAQDASNIYIAQDVPTASEKGVDSLIDIMDGNGLDFFKSSGSSKASGPSGIIGSNDIVLIKVNGEWQDRGGTNTDVVKGIIQAIVNHPDGFTGEVAIVENGQWASFMDNRTDNRNPDRCNAEDRSQSFNDVAQMFAERHRVSVYDWTAIQHDVVGEYNQGDYSDGYVYVPEKEVGYPKFTTVYGTHISLRYGYWNGAGYDNARVKFLNVPVLKDHSTAGVTASIKHFMGVQDRWKNTDEPPHTPMRTEGFQGKMMLLARYPDLNIVDAIWVTPASGPNAPYDQAVRLNRLLASQDPVALDYYCGKYVLMPVSGSPQHDPNSAGTFFHDMLFSTYDVLAAAGKQVTVDENRMNVYTKVDPDDIPATTYEYFLAEGCTGYGFETWILVANPGDQAANVDITYLTESGSRNAEPLVVPPLSRLTVNASAGIWQQSAGVRIGSDRPVYVERAMYWNDRSEGHDSIGASAGARDWYLADGHTADGFETWVEILNPAGSDTSATLTCMTQNGSVQGPTVMVPSLSRVTVDVGKDVPPGDVSVHVSSAAPVVVERSMYWSGRRGGSGTIGVSSPSTDWYFAEGATHSGFETYLLIMNPQAQDARVSVEFVADGSGGAGPAVKDLVVPAGTRRTLKADEVIAGADVSMNVHSSIPVVAERSMLWSVSGGRAGHATIGMKAPASEVFLPEGCTAYGFETWLLLENPGDKEADVSVYAMTEGGQRALCEVNLGPQKRRSVRLNDLFSGNFSVRVVSSKPVVCERSVYWNNKAGGTCSIGY